MEPDLKKFYEDQISQFKDARPLYNQFETLLKHILKNLVEGCSSEFVIKGRTKTISSFANKMSRPDKNYINPINEINDLCGMRIILPNFDELNEVCEIIRENFIVVDEFSEKDIENMKISDFWYGSRILIVQLLPSLLLYDRLNLEIPDEIYALKAEFQVRTFLSHGWAANQYNILNRSGFKVPSLYVQELSRVAALLEIGDSALNEITEKMRNYESVYGAYMDQERIRDEIERLEVVYAANKKNIDIAYRIAKLAMTINEFDKAIEIFYEILKTEEWKTAPDLKMARILRDLGISSYIKFKNNPHGEDYKRGQSHLKTAVNRNPKDHDACTTLAGSYRKQNNLDEALKYYKLALEHNPGEPYPLGNYLILMIQKKGDLSVVDNSRDMIQNGIEKRLRQIEVMVDIPWAFFDVGLFNLFLGRIFESLDYYLKAIRFSPDIWMIETTLNTLEGLKNVYEHLTGIEYIRALLYLGILFHPNKNQESKELADKRLSETFDHMEKHSCDTVVIIAGGTDERIEKSLQKYRDNIIRGFKNFECTVIGGGTKSGISAFVGDIQKEYSNTIRTIGYIPSHLPSNVEIDKRNSQIYTTKGKDFTVLESLQYWYDIYKSGIEPNKVKLIGINGGRIAEFEFHLAITFGAQVGIVENSGRAASDLINDLNWTVLENDDISEPPQRLFKVLKNSMKELQKFLTEPFIINQDIETIQKVLIQHRESGMNIFEMSFISEDIDDTIFGGFLSALDQIALTELRVGEILSIKFKEGFLIGGIFSDNSFKVVFLLNKSPSKSLESKVAIFIEDVESKLGKCLHILHERCRSYEGGVKMNKILSKIFGTEILKLVNTNIDDRLLQYPNECFE